MAASNEKCGKSARVDIWMRHVSAGNFGFARAISCLTKAPKMNFIAGAQV
jgi:hypothetical protein